MSMMWKVPADVTVLKVSNSRLALADLSAAWFGHPAEKLTTIGVTGTKGKTTTTYMMRQMTGARRAEDRPDRHH